MARWKSKLKIGKHTKRFEAGEITSRELGKLVAGEIDVLQKRNRIMFRGRNNELKDIMVRFDHECESVEAFDDVLEELYNWADVDHICWVDTFE